MRRFGWVVGLLLLGGTSCGGSNAQLNGAVINAAINTALAVGVSAAQRSQGGCYAICIDGTVCNPQNGLCERRRCTRGCGPTGTCDADGMCRTVAPGGQVIPLMPSPNLQPTLPSSPSTSPASVPQNPLY